MSVSLTLQGSDEHFKSCYKQFLKLLGCQEIKSCIQAAHGFKYLYDDYRDHGKTAEGKKAIDEAESKILITCTSAIRNHPEVLMFGLECRDILAEAGESWEYLNYLIEGMWDGGFSFL